MIFDIAKKVAYAACELDWLRKASTQAAASEAESHINTLHECAMELAGKRACEIYTDPYEFCFVEEGKNPSEPPASAQVIELCGHRKCDKP